MKKIIFTSLMLMCSAGYAKEHLRPKELIDYNNAKEINTKDCVEMAELLPSPTVDPVFLYSISENIGKYPRMKFTFDSGRRQYNDGFENVVYIRSKNDKILLLSCGSMFKKSYLEFTNFKTIIDRGNKIVDVLKQNRKTSEQIKQDRINAMVEKY